MAFTLSDLKVGYLVETREGKRYIAMPHVGDGSLILTSPSGWLELEHDAEMNDPDDPRWDITKVWGLARRTTAALSLNSAKERDLLYDREVVEAPEMTLEDIEKELGHKFRLVK